MTSDLAKKIFIQKQMSKGDVAIDDVAMKSDVSKTLEKLIENLNKFRQEFCSQREPRFIHKPKQVVKKQRKKAI